MTAPLVIMVGADKGGVGKTLTCRILADYLTWQNVPFRAIDTEHPAGGLVRFLRSAEIVDIETIDGQMRAFDTLQGITLIDVRAGQLSKILRILDQAQMLENVKNGNMRLALLHVLGPSFQSLQEVGGAAKALGASAAHYLVKNRISATTQYFEWEGPTSIHAAALARMKNVTLTMPHFEDRAIEAMDARAMSFLQFAQDGGGSPVLKGYTRFWLMEAWKELERVGLGALCKDAAAAA